jgi:hypothetical protein
LHLLHFMQHGQIKEHPAKRELKLPSFIIKPNKF